MLLSEDLFMYNLALSHQQAIIPALSKLQIFLIGVNETRMDGGGSGKGKQETENGW